VGHWGNTGICAGPVVLDRAGMWKDKLAGEAGIVRGAMGGRSSGVVRMRSKLGAAGVPGVPGTVGFLTSKEQD